MKKTIILAIVSLILSVKTALCYEVQAICEDKEGNADVYIFNFENESDQEINAEIYEYCKNIGRLYIGDIGD